MKFCFMKIIPPQVTFSLVSIKQLLGYSSQSSRQIPLPNTVQSQYIGHCVLLFEW